MENIRDSFTNAVNCLLLFAKNKCVNYIPDKTVYIKSYIIGQAIEYRDILNIYDSFYRKDLYSEEDIIKDLCIIIKRGYYIERIGLSLYYVTETESYVVVSIDLSQVPVLLRYHISLTVTLDSPKDSIDVNEYVDTIMSQRKK